MNPWVHFVVVYAVSFAVFFFAANLFRMGMPAEVAQQVYFTTLGLGALVSGVIAGVSSV
jgi:hypothetical protein